MSCQSLDNPAGGSGVNVDIFVFASNRYIFSIGNEYETEKYILCLNCIHINVALFKLDKLRWLHYNVLLVFRDFVIAV